MSELAGLAPKPKEFDINGIKLSFVPIEFDEDCASLLEMDKMDSAKQVNQIKLVIKKMLKKSYPESPDKELEDALSINNIIPLMNAFTSVMGLDTQESKSRIQVLKDVQRQKIEQARKEAGQPAA